MDKFCKFCGKPLVEGKCDCDGFKAANAATSTNAENTSANNEGAGSAFSANTNASNGAFSSTPNATNNTANNANANMFSATANAPKKEKKPLSPKAIGIAVVAAVVVILVAVLALTHKTTVNLSNYITVTTEGYEGYGKASYEFDYEQFLEDYSGKLKFTSSGKKEYKDSFDELDSLGLSALGDAISGEISPESVIALAAEYSGSLDKTDGLSNGDVVTFTWDIDKEEIEKAIKCKIKCDDVETTVENLDEISTIDLFKNVEVTFSGTAPDGYVSVTEPGTYDGISYDADVYNDVTNGDVITVTASTYSSLGLEQYCIENFGGIPAETTKEYTVSGLPEYVTDFSQIPDEDVELMKKEMEDQIEADAASWNDDVTLSSMDYVGLVLFDRKSYSGNSVMVVYKVTANINFEKKEGGTYNQNVEYYLAGRFDDLILQEDGTLSIDLDQCYMGYNSFRYDTNTTKADSYGKRSFWFDGYETYAKFEKDNITAKKGDYNISTNYDAPSASDSSSTDASKEASKDASTAESSESTSADSTDSASTESSN